MTSTSSCDGSGELLKLDNQLCFRLYAASRAITQVYRPMLDELDLTYPQYLVLLAMWQWDDESQLDDKTLKDLTARLHLDSGTMTPLYRRMEDAGLVGRQVNEQDKRASLIRLSAKGSALKQQAEQALNQVLCQFAGPDDPLGMFNDLRDQLDVLLLKLQSE